ncbi:hypothetical protein GCM10023221_23080 [Luteimicrobium xylanilyticum]|uniref:Uncharacterized protein n=1 Tax=Luteimicrobium xylanilyticum TaxID=1133546 RepID=A0A5P9Q5V2_9MICO|nr:hypothetical protein [Luteimicrobium xylanilyticum]QFU96761.1 hypothetical protein KDY119_00250 [Luteimicrobium xylanilyticum]
MTAVTVGRGDAWLAGALWLVAGAGFGFAISVVGLATVPAALVVAALLPTVGPRWALAGLTAVAAAVVAIVGPSAATVGLAALAAALLVVAALGGSRRAPGHLAFLALSGAGALPLVVAWLNRHGPGDTCTAHAGGPCVADTEELSPWPWLVAGVVLVVAGVVLTTVMARRRRAVPPTRVA